MQLNNGIKCLIQHFNNYLVYGLYPFFTEVKAKYHERLLNVIQVILENDLIAIENLNFSTIVKLKKTLVLIAESVPFKPNISELSNKVGVSRDFLVRLLNLLEAAGLILMVRQYGAPSGILTKPEKIYLENTNLLFAMSNENQVNRGTLRETFFIHQLSQHGRVEISRSGDFILDGKVTVEVGGKNKSFKQLAGIDNSFLALDDIELGSNRTIHLWLFGFLY